MSLIKKLFRNYFLLSVICIILGIALIANPDSLPNAISYTIGGISLGIGVISALRYFLAGENKNEYFYALFRGIVLCAIGIFLIIRPDFIFKIIAVAFGLYMLFNGIVSLSDALEIRKAEGSWVLPCVMASITTLLGLVITFNPLMAVDFAVRIMGISLTISGITNLSGCLSGARQLKAIAREIDEAEKNSRKKSKKSKDFIDI